MSEVPSAPWVFLAGGSVWCPCVALRCGSSGMGHAIPPHVFQALKSRRWGCNVLGALRKVGSPGLHATVGVCGAWGELLCSVLGPRCCSPCLGRVGVVGGVGVKREGRHACGGPSLSIGVLWRCPTLPQPIGCSTIGAAGLSFQVRNVAGRFPGAVTTTRLFVQHHPPPRVLGGGCGLIVVCIVVAAVLLRCCFVTRTVCLGGCLVLAH